MRFRGMILVLIVAAFAILLFPVGCGREPREVVIDESANDGEMIVLQVGDTLVLKLDSNPTTGYGWQRVEDPLDEAVLELIAYEYIPREHVPGHVGVGGQEVWRFRACAEGETLLDLEYVRSWETDVEPAKTFFVWVTVEP